MHESWGVLLSPQDRGVVAGPAGAGGISISQGGVP